MWAGPDTGRADADLVMREETHDPHVQSGLSGYTKTHAHSRIRNLGHKRKRNNSTSAQR